MNNIEPDFENTPKNGEPFVPVIEAEEIKKLQYIQPSESKFSSMKVYLIIEQILLWGLLVYLIVDIVVLKFYSVSITLFAVIYVIHLLCFCFSPELSFLGNKIEDKTMYDIMFQYFSAAPKITLKTESYHMVLNRKKKRRSKKKVVTHSEEEQFKYYSFKDVSGLFSLSIPQEKNIMYIKLQIINEINFADPISYADYKKQKEALYKRNRKRDRGIDYFERRDYDGYLQFNLVKLKGQDSCFFNRGFYILCIILTFGLVYYAIFNHYCHEQTFRVRKLISTRYNLMDKEYSTKYESFRPILSFKSEVYKYNEKDTGFVYESNKMAPPSYDEIEKAKQFQNFIPDYQISSVGGVILVNNNNLNQPSPKDNEINGSNQVIELNEDYQGKNEYAGNNINNENIIQQLNGGVECAPKKDQYLIIDEENKKI